MQDSIGNTPDPIRVVIKTNSLDIIHLPWEQWNFWDTYYEENDLVVSFDLSSNLDINDNDSEPQISSDGKTRFLAILGSDKDINLEYDRQEFEKLHERLNQLEDRASIEIKICQPSLTELKEILAENWHVIYYGGHSQTIDEGRDGILFLAGGSEVKISKLEQFFKGNIDNGYLKLLIANACDGIGTAFRLRQIGLSHAIVMRESIPDDIAHEFLRYLLESFLIGLPTSSAVYYSKPHLREAYDMGHLLPGASMLPVLCVGSKSSDELDAPVLKISGIEPIRTEMRALATLAKARLILVDSNNLSSELQILEFYADSLKNKNKVTEKVPPYEIQLSDISCEYRTEGKLIWIVSFFANIREQKIIWGQGYVNIKTGYSELLLDNRPSSWLDTPVIIDGEKIYSLNIPKNTQVIIDSNLQELSLTKIAILELNLKYKEYAKSIENFDGSPYIRQFGGWLKDTNKKKFLKEFAILTVQGLSEEEIKQKAYASTAFGTARSELGITDFHITLPSERYTTLNEIVINDQWTPKDKQELRDGNVSEDLWTNLRVPNIIIVDKAQRTNEGG